jgi:hypothetical protein
MKCHGEGAQLDVAVAVNIRSVIDADTVMQIMKAAAPLSPLRVSSTTPEDAGFLPEDALLVPGDFYPGDFQGDWMRELVAGAMKIYDVQHYMEQHPPTSRTFCGVADWALQAFEQAPRSDEAVKCHGNIAYATGPRACVKQLGFASATVPYEGALRLSGTCGGSGRKPLYASADPTKVLRAIEQAVSEKLPQGVPRRFDTAKQATGFAETFTGIHRDSLLDADVAKARGACRQGEQV